VTKMARAVKAHVLRATRRFTRGGRGVAEEAPRRNGDQTAAATPQRHVDEWRLDATCHEDHLGLLRCSV